MEPALLQNEQLGVLAEARPQFGNPLLLQQFANQRAANPRPDPFPDVARSWGQYPLGATLAQQFPGVGSDPALVRQAAANLAMSWGPLATVFHGSPYLFPKFDMSKIGTGEGAQSYGHGLYLAENPAVANEYRRNLAAKDMTLDGKPFQQTLENYNIHQLVGEYGSDLSKLKSELQSYISKNQGNPYADVKGASAIVDGIDRKSFHPGGGGNLYKVDLPDEHIAKMLDWDRPLSQQPETVKKALRESGWVRDVDKINTPAGEYFRTSGGIDAAAAQELRKMGIPGIKYLDQGSRAGGQGTNNYVVFDETLPKIIGRE
jgi:hypothetical protein